MNDAARGSSFDEFYRSELDRQVRRAYLLTGSAALADDVVHDAMVAMYRRWSVIDQPAAYLNRAVLNGCRDAGRRAVRQRRLVARLSEPPGEAAPRDVLDDVLAALPFQQRAAVVLRYYESRSTAEIAQMLGCAPGSVGPWIDRALSAMRKGPGMNDVETLLSDHLRAKATELDVVSRLDQVHAQRAARATQARRLYVVRPAWLGIAAGAVAVAGVGVALANRVSDSGAPAPTVPSGALPVEPGPTVNDHWHEAYAFWLCGEWVTLRGALEQPLNEAYVASGLHSHDDGVVHIHPFGTAGSGSNATLGTFLAGYGVELTDESLRFPPDQRSDELPMTCDGAPAQLSVTVWRDAADAARSATFTDDLADVPLRDGAAMTIALAPPGTPIPMPPAAPDLDALGAADGAAVTTEAP